MINIGDAVPDFNFTSTEKDNDKFSNYKDKTVVFYFYPKDSTPGCTMESKDFRDHIDQFKAKNVQIFGISRDSIASHDKFKDKHALPFPLISDGDETLCEIFNVIGIKNMFGKKIRGLIRSTFIVHNGELVNEWRKVKVKGHVKEVLAALK